jgi:hypothetical protein
MESEASDLDTRSVSHQIGAARFPVHHLKSNPERPDVLELERSHLADDLALVPRLAMSRNRNGAHDGLPSS